LIYEFSIQAFAVFAIFVAFTLGLSFYLGRKTKSAKGYYAAGGGIPWFVNGIAFAGDYLSAASFLGICGLIAFYGYDGFLYSIGYLAGWVVALFVVAEPLKRLGKYTFADALTASFSPPYQGGVGGVRSIKLAAAVSTLAISLFYLIPQMVGAGVLIKPLLGLPHYAGVLIVGALVVLIVVTAGMVSTTWVQFLKGGLLVVFCTVLTGMILWRGVEPNADVGYRPHAADGIEMSVNEGPWEGRPYHLLYYSEDGIQRGGVLRRYSHSGKSYIFRVIEKDGHRYLASCQFVTITPDGQRIVNGWLESDRDTGRPGGELQPVGHMYVGEESFFHGSTGPVSPLDLLRTIDRGNVVLWASEKITEADGSVTTVYYPKPTPGSDVLRPGTSHLFPGISTGKLTDQLNFLSLMLALFCGTASLPHILIRYYTVKDQASARKSTVVGIASIGFFYILTLFIGLGAMTSGALDVTNSNMAAPLLARSFGEWMFAIISAIAFTTVLGTVAGLIVAASGAVVHDLVGSVFKVELNDSAKVRLGKLTAVGVGLIAIVLGILFENMNVSYLVGWAFSIAASANLPALVMLLFWKGTTKQGITAAIVVGMLSSLAWILLSGDTYKDVYKLDPANAIVPFSQPGIVTIPLGFAVLIVVSLLTKRQDA
jgi:cation/acetate symporter